MIYMFNLIFDATDPDAALEGRFKEDDTGQTVAFQRSKVWLQTSSSDPGQDSPGDWSLKQASSDGPLQLAPQDQVWIRVQGLNTTSAWVARLTTVLSRHSARATQNANTHKPYQTRGSPFPDPLSSNQSCVLYDFENETYQAISSGGSWLEKLGAVTFTTPPPVPAPDGFHDSYSVIVAVTAGLGAQAGQGQNTDPTGVATYSHDPDMDVQC